MLTVGLFPNSKKPQIGMVVGRLIQQFQERQVRVLLPAETARELNLPALARSRETLKQEINLGVTIGGDGTLINAAREVAPAGVPVCGVNMGQLGFLNAIEPSELDAAVDRLVRGDYQVEERVMLDAFVRRRGTDYYVASAVNDVVVTKGGTSRMIRLNLYLDNELAARYPADGLIIATATGSTGYSLSAGGPIIHPGLKSIVLAPICAHTLNTRSLVIPAEQEIKVTIQASHNDIVLTLDGQILRKLGPNDAIVVRQAQVCARFVRFPDRSFARTLYAKLWPGDDHENP